MVNKYRSSLLGETVREAFDDKYKLVGSLAVDGYGAASTLGYLLGIAPGVLGDIKDSITGIGQTGWILAAYWKDLKPWQRATLGVVSTLEEWGPVVTDLFPSATIAHFTAAYNRAKGNLENYDRAEGAHAGSSRARTGQNTPLMNDKNR